VIILMLKKIVLLVAAIALGGCGGPVIGSQPDTTSPTAGSAPNAFPGNDYRLPTYGLPIAYFPITIKRDDKCVLTASLDKPVYARDPGKNYTLAYYHHSYTDDSLTVQTDDVGLLMGINTTSENQQLAIVDQTVALAAQVARLTAQLNVHLPLARLNGPAPKVNVAPPPPTCAAFSLTYVFDPLNARGSVGVDALNVLLKPAKAHVEPAQIIGAGMGGAKDDTTFCTARDAEAGQCVYFRVTRTYALSVEDDQDATNHGITLLLQAPDPDHDYAIPLRRKDFVKFDVKLTFDHGVLTSFASNDPSQLLAVLAIPSDLIKDVLGFGTSGSGSSGK
jgi:hypothetical protein